MNHTLIVTFRSGSMADLPGVRFVDPLMRADPDRAASIRAALSSGESVVALDGDEVVGFALFNYSFFRCGFVPLLVVGIGSRRNGVGTALLNEIERRCRKPKLFVSANRSNLPAQWLFEKCGFVQSGRIENVDLDDDELIYFKRIRHGA